MVRRVDWRHHNKHWSSRMRQLSWLALKLLLCSTLCAYAYIISRSTGRGHDAAAVSTYKALHLQRKIVAYAITVTADGPYMDGAAVLAYAILKASSASKYGIDLVAFVHPSVQDSRQALEKAGWRLIERNLPVDTDKIRGKYLREHIAKGGCCGATELLKLYAWLLTDYHRVVHLDMDSLMLQNMDELYDLDLDFIYTCDYGMMTPGSKVCPVQGGFFVLRPSQAIFDGLVETILEGDFREGSAWGGEHIGWYWGGMTIQGLLPYFFTRRNPPERALEADRCVYNNMFDNPDCKEKAPDAIKNIHFTVCQKPWSCAEHGPKQACTPFLGKWHSLREEVRKHAITCHKRSSLRFSKQGQSECPVISKESTIQWSGYCQMVQSP